MSPLSKFYDIVGSELMQVEIRLQGQEQASASRPVSLHVIIAIQPIRLSPRKAPDDRIAVSQLDQLGEQQRHHQRAN